MEVVSPPRALGASPVLPATTRFGFLAEPEALLDRKLESNRAFTASMCLLAAVGGMSLWWWDHVTDPVGAARTLTLRSGYGAMLLVGLAVRYVPSRRALAGISVGAVLAEEVVLIAILNRLDTGMQYGIGGLMYFMFMPMLLLTCFSWRVNVLCTLLAAALPQVMAVMGYAPGFEHAHYAVLIWPTAGLISFVHLVSARSYRHRFDLEMALEAASNTDALTGLSNRRHFMPAVEQEVRRRQRYGSGVSVAMLDIDHFKQINDAHGHPTGDRAICALGETCREISRDTDLVARLGGEELAILLPETDPSSAKQVAERIRGAVEAMKLVSAGGVPFRFTVSIGVAGLARGEAGSKSLIELADAALYRAKREGRNRVVLSEDARDRAP
jgi:diguanylate cyclase (GGDEF)-like protein